MNLIWKIINGAIGIIALIGVFILLGAVMFGLFIAVIIAFILHKIENRHLPIRRNIKRADVVKIK